MKVKDPACSSGTHCTAYQRARHGRVVGAAGAGRRHLGAVRLECGWWQEGRQDRLERAVLQGRMWGVQTLYLQPHTSNQTRSLNSQLPLRARQRKLFILKLNKQMLILQLYQRDLYKIPIPTNAPQAHLIFQFMQTNMFGAKVVTPAVMQIKYSPLPI